jgi:anti-sigma regulatory factor (Ser/Thr protein kinase)
VHELAANTVRHAGGPGRLTIWTEPGLIVCQVEDGGHIADPLAGRRSPPPGSMTGRGLLLVNQLCDLVRIRSGPDGTAIRVQMSTGAGGVELDSGPG